MQDFSTTTTTLGRKDRILVADDADIGRGILRALLRKEYDVIEARNGLEVVQLLRSSPGDIDCILLDVMMPVMDGIKVLQFMKENDLLDRIPTVALTAISDADGKISCYEAGAIDIIEKPYDQKLLLYKVRHIIDTFRNTRREAASEASSEKLDYVRSILDALPVAVFVLDATTRRIKFGNALFRQIPHCPQKVEGAVLDTFLPPGALVGIEKSASALLTRHTLEPAEIDDLAPGQRYTVAFNALQDENGAITDLIGTVINTTGEAKTSRQLEERLRAPSLRKGGL